MVLVLHLIGLENGESFLDQAQGEVNQTKPVTFDTRSKTTSLEALSYKVQLPHSLPHAHSNK